MNAVGIVLVGVLGLVVGGAVWTASWLRATERPLRAGPLCANPGCAKPLPPLAWLPLWGFGLRRRCPRCGAGQPPRRIVFEVAVALYYALAAVRLGEDPGRLVAALVFAVPLLNILLVDAWTRFIHTDVIAVGLVIGLGGAALDGGGALLSAILAVVAAAAVFACFFALAAVIYRNVAVVPFGLGDVYLAGMIGAMVRLDGVIRALFLGVLLAGLAGVALLVSRRVSRRQAIAYGPYLCAGALLTLVL